MSEKPIEKKKGRPNKTVWNSVKYSRLMMFIIYGQAHQPSEGYVEGLNTTQGIFKKLAQLHRLKVELKDVKAPSELDKRLAEVKPFKSQERLSQLLARWHCKRVCTRPGGKGQNHPRYTDGKWCPIHESITQENEDRCLSHFGRRGTKYVYYVSPENWEVIIKKMLEVVEKDFNDKLQELTLDLEGISKESIQESLSYKSIDDSTRALSAKKGIFTKSLKPDTIVGNMFSYYIQELVLLNYYKPLEQLFKEFAYMLGANYQHFLRSKEATVGLKAFELEAFLEACKAYFVICNSLPGFTVARVVTNILGNIAITFTKEAERMEQLLSPKDYSFKGGDATKEVRLAKK